MKVYFILDSASNAVKIGKANDIQERLSVLQTGNPNPLTLINFIDCGSEAESFLLEQTLHRQYKNLRKMGEWFTYDENVFGKLFEQKINFQRKITRNSISIQTLFGTEHFGVESFPCCFFYPNLSAQIMTNYEEAVKKGNPFRTMRYPTEGKCMLLPWSKETDKVFISDRKHKENLKLQNFQKKENGDISGLEKFFETLETGPEK